MHDGFLLKANIRRLRITRREGEGKFLIFYFLEKAPSSCHRNKNTPLEVDSWASVSDNSPPPETKQTKSCMLSSELELWGKFFDSTEKVFTDITSETSTVMLWLEAVALFALEGGRSLTVVIDGNYMVWSYSPDFFFIPQRFYYLWKVRDVTPEW